MLLAVTLLSTLDQVTLCACPATVEAYSNDMYKAFQAVPGAL
jgi:hypothetical protein